MSLPSLVSLFFAAAFIVYFFVWAIWNANQPEGSKEWLKVNEKPHSFRNALKNFFIDIGVALIRFFIVVIVAVVRFLITSGRMIGRRGKLIIAWIGTKRTEILEAHAARKARKIESIIPRSRQPKRKPVSERIPAPLPAVEKPAAVSSEEKMAEETRARNEASSSEPDITDHEPPEHHSQEAMPEAEVSALFSGVEPPSELPISDDTETNLPVSRECPSKPETEPEISENSLLYAILYENDQKVGALKDDRFELIGAQCDDLAENLLDGDDVARWMDFYFFQTGEVTLVSFADDSSTVNAKSQAAGDDTSAETAEEETRRDPISAHLDGSLRDPPVAADSSATDRAPFVPDAEGEVVEITPDGEVVEISPKDVMKISLPELLGSNVSETSAAKNPPAAATEAETRAALKIPLESNSAESELHETIEDLTVTMPVIKTNTEGNMKWLKSLMEMFPESLGIRKILGSLLEKDPAAEGFLISVITRDAAENEDEAAKLRKSAIAQENLNVTDEFLLAAEKLRLRKVQIGYALKSRELFGEANKGKITSAELLTAENLRTNCQDGEPRGLPAPSDVTEEQITER